MNELPSVKDVQSEPKGWETLDAKQKEFICFRNFLGTDKATCQKAGIALEELDEWRKGTFGKLEKYYLKQPLTLAHSLFDDMLPIAAFRVYRSLVSGDERTAESAEKTVFKVMGVLGEEIKGGTKVVVINLPFERKSVASTDYRLIEGVSAPLGTEDTPRIAEKNQGS